MPTLTVAGHDITVGDDFLKLSPEDQQSMVNHIAQHLPAEKPASGVVAGFQHGVESVAGGDASTLKLTGADTPNLDAVASHVAPKDYQPSKIIRDGGHWYNPLDYNPRAIPQSVAEAAPGIAQDTAAGWTGSKLGSAFGLPGRVIGGAVGAGGSALLRTFGPGAHENADARTGVPNSPVETPDLVREGVKQTVEAPLNMVEGSRLVPGLSQGGSALTKYLTTMALGGARSAANTEVNKVGATVGTPGGVQQPSGNDLASSAVTGAAAAGAATAPRLAVETANNVKYAPYESSQENQAAAEALANRQLKIADGRKLIGAFGGTKVAADVVNGAHADVHSELADAVKGETLSPDNANTMSRIQSEGPVSPGEVDALSNEASPATMHLARQALASKRLRDTGTLTDDKFTGGLGGAMENFTPIKNPIKTGVATGLATAAGHGLFGGVLGTIAPPVLGGIYGTYGLARLADRLSGSRSPAQGFTDRFGGNPDTPVRLPNDTPADVVDPYDPSAGPWGPRLSSAGSTGPSVPLPDDPSAPGLSKTLKTNASLEDGMARIAKKLGDEKRKAMITAAMPALKDLAAANQPPAPEAAAPAAPAAPAFDPLAMPPDIVKRATNLTKGMALAQKMRDAQTGQQAADSLASQSPLINSVGGLSAVSNPNVGSRAKQLVGSAKALQALMKQPEEEEAPSPTPNAGAAPSPAAPPPPSPAPQAAQVAPSAPEAPSISQLIANMRAKSEAAQAANPAATPPGGAVPPTADTPSIAPEATAPQIPQVAKIKKAKGLVTQTPHPEAPQQEHMDPETGELFNYTPLRDDQLYGQHMSHEEFAKNEAAAKIATGELKPENRELYENGVIHDRMKREHELMALSQNAETPTDVPIAKRLLQELHHTRRGEHAGNAIKYFGSQMSPRMRRAAGNLMTGPFHKMWSKEKADAL